MTLSSSGSTECLSSPATEQFGLLALNLKRSCTIVDKTIGLGMTNYASEIFFQSYFRPLAPNYIEQIL